MTAVNHNESKDFADRKVNIQVLQGKLLHKVHLSHLCCRHASLARVSMKMWCFLIGHAAINGANCTLWRSFPCKLKEYSSATDIFWGNSWIHLTIDNFPSGEHISWYTFLSPVRCTRNWVNDIQSCQP